MEFVVGRLTTQFFLREMRLEKKKNLVVGIFMIYPIFRDQKKHDMRGVVLTYYTYYILYLLSIF